MSKNIVMIGSGYVGLVSGTCFAELGHSVVCVDKNAEKIAALERGEMPIYEPGLKELVLKNQAAGRLRFSTELDLEETDAVFLAVGTPTNPETDNADLTYLFAAAEEVKLALRGHAVIVTKSTVPVGTGAKLKEIFGEVASIASNPEFLREGCAIGDFMQPDRIVCGVDTEGAKRILADIYSPLKAQMLFTTIATAELSKYAANAMLATRVTFINEMADLCEKTGADILQLAHAVGLDNRIGNKFLQAGPGVGGSCFPKDTRALAAQAREFGLRSNIIEGVVKSNLEHQERVAERIAAKVGSGSVAVFGLAFKANTDDMREAPALIIIPKLQEAGLRVKAYDPQAANEAAKILHGVEFCDSAAAAAEGADAIVILTEWEEFVKLDYTTLKPAKKLVFDTRNILAAKQPVGYEYVGLGR
jgi:UDPglucose 6-dehydrogenase